MKDSFFLFIFVLMSSLRGISKLAQSIAGPRKHIFQHNSSKPSFAMPELISLVLGQLNIIRSELRKKNTLYPAPEMGKTFLNAWLYLFCILEDAIAGHGRRSVHATILNIMLLFDMCTCCIRSGTKNSHTWSLCCMVMHLLES